MEKQVCKVLYKAEMPKEYKNILLGGTEIGIFENFDDAYIASNLWVRILKEIFKKSDLLNKVNFKYALTKVLVPDDEHVKYYCNLDEFKNNDLYVGLYSCKKGQNAISALENKIKQELNELSRADKIILTRKKECDVTHPPITGHIKNLTPYKSEPEEDVYVL